MKIASVALLMVSTFLAICSRVNLSNKREMSGLGNVQCIISFHFSFLPFFIEMSPQFCYSLNSRHGPVHQAS